MATIIEGADPANVSDGYHTLDELYEHRCTLFAVLMLSNRELSWRSMRHHDGTNYDGWFIAGMRLPAGPVTYHMPMRLWGMLRPVETLERAPEWDGHTSADVLERLRRSFSGEQRYGDRAD